MADEAQHGIQRLHPEDRKALTQGVVAELRAVFEASARGPAVPVPPPGPFDARAYAQLRDDMLADIAKAVREETSEFLPEDVIDARIASVTQTIDQRFERFETTFLSKVQQAIADGNAVLRSELFDIFDDLGMSLEKGEKRKATRERLGGLFAMHESSKEFRQEFWKMARTSLIAWLLGLGSAVGAYLGFRGGPPH